MPWPVDWRAIFQPAEETCVGAAEMVRAGALEGVRSIFSLHVDPSRPVGAVGLRPGPLTAIRDALAITVEGKGGHGARPHETRDPIAAATQLVTTLYQLIPRRTDAHDAVVLSFGKIAGGIDANVIPSSVELAGTLRTVNEEVRLRTLEQIAAIAAGIAAATETTISIDNYSSLPAVDNDTELTPLVWRAAEDVVGPDAVQQIPKPSMGSEDFANYLREVPGVMFRLGTASSEANRHALHTARFDIDEAALTIGVRVLARAVIAASHPTVICGQ